MDKSEFYEELEMSYFELSYYLQNKYGLPKRAFFATSKCVSESKDIKRANTDGLFIHHIRECFCDNLSKKFKEHSEFVDLFCLQNLLSIEDFYWESQQPQHLCYCNLLEHLILHFKINEIRRDGDYFDSNCQERNDFELLSLGAGLFSGGVGNYLIPQLQDIYKNPDKIYTDKKQLWRNIVKEKILNNEEEFNYIIKEMREQEKAFNALKFSTFTREGIVQELESIFGNQDQQFFQACLCSIENYLCYSTCPFYETCCAYGASWLMVEDYCVEDNKNKQAY